MSDTLSLPPDPRSLAFREFCRRIKNAPGLQGTITLKSWEGEEDDPKPPGTGELPCVRLTPRPGRWERQEHGNFVAPILVRVETWLEGYDVEDGIDLWGLIEGVILSDELRDALAEFGVYSFDILGPGGYGVEPHPIRWEPVIANGIYSYCDVEFKIAFGPD